MYIFGRFAKKLFFCFVFLKLKNIYEFVDFSAWGSLLFMI